MENVRIYEMPACRMASSGAGMFGDGVLERFDQWFSALPREMFPRDYLWFSREKDGFVWYYRLDDGAEAPDGFEIVDFPGGLYAVVTGIDGQDSAPEHEAIARFLAESPKLERDPEREELGNIITPPAAREAMGYNQMDYYTPVRVKA